jgi:peptidoglycan/xylan/chitin deacetylase (PgdA/CDA1 family)
VIITFDDGEMNNFKNAFSILKQFGLGAYFFVTVSRIGKRGYMGWEELKELRDAGMTIGSHGLNHDILTTLKDRQIERELWDSKEILEHNLKVNIDYFSVPRGFYNKNIIETARRIGYKKVFVSVILQNSNEICLGRTAIRPNWSLARFEQALQGKIPLHETGIETAKNILKKTVRAEYYEKIRGLLLRTRR